METQIEDGRSDTLAIIEHGKRLVIRDLETFNEAGEFGLEIAKAIKQTNGHWSIIVQKAKASYDEVKSSRDSELEPLERMAGHIGDIRSKWKIEQDRIAIEEQLRLQRIETEKAEKERQKLLEKAVAAKTLEKAEALFEKAELVYEKYVHFSPVIEKTIKTETGGRITWVKDIEVAVNDARALCRAIGDGSAPTTIVEFKNLKTWVKANSIKQFAGLTINEIQRESKRV